MALGQFCNGYHSLLQEAGAEDKTACMYRKLHLISSMGVPPIVSALVVPLVPWSKNIMLFVILFVIIIICHSANDSNDSFRI